MSFPLLQYSIHNSRIYVLLDLYPGDLGNLDILSGHPD